MSSVSVCSPVGRLIKRVVGRLGLGSLAPTADHPSRQTSSLLNQIVAANVAVGVVYIGNTVTGAEIRVLLPRRNEALQYAGHEVAFQTEG
jgi:hypothetical protein